METIKKGLEELSKPQLVDALVKLAKNGDSNLAFIAELTSGKENRKRKRTDSGDAFFLEGLRSDLRRKLEETEKEAEDSCGGKWHLYDTSACVGDVDEVHDKWIAGKHILSPVATLEALCELAPALVPHLEGKFYDFEGDCVLINLDESVVETLKASKATELPQKVLEKVTEVFSEEYWAEYQGYGIFEDAPSKLKGGSIAKSLMAQNKN